MAEPIRSEREVPRERGPSSGRTARSPSPAPFRPLALPALAAAIRAGAGTGAVRAATTAPAARRGVLAAQDALD